MEETPSHHVFGYGSAQLAALASHGYMEEIAGKVVDELSRQGLYEQLKGKTPVEPAVKHRAETRFYQPITGVAERVVYRLIHDKE
eukprot:scaffold9916_cov100-Skeletonema_dohrnii-CCMP3373.AAC.3